VCQLWHAESDVVWILILKVWKEDQGSWRWRARQRLPWMHWERIPV